MCKVSCPNCLGTKQIMTPRKSRGFDYNRCKLCDENGLVDEEIAEDYALSMNEDLIEEIYPDSEDY